MHLGNKLALPVSYSLSHLRLLTLLFYSPSFIPHSSSAPLFLILTHCTRIHLHIRFLIYICLFWLLAAAFDVFQSFFVVVTVVAIVISMCGLHIEVSVLLLGKDDDSYKLFVSLFSFFLLIISHWSLRFLVHTHARSHPSPLPTHKINSRTNKKSLQSAEKSNHSEFLFKSSFTMARSACITHAHKCLSVLLNSLRFASMAQNCVRCPICRHVATAFLLLPCWPPYEWTIVDFFTAGKTQQFNQIKRIISKAINILLIDVLYKIYEDELNRWKSAVRWLFCWLNWSSFFWNAYA